MIFLRRKPSIFPLFCWWRCHEVGKRQSDWTNISWVMWQNGLQAQLCIRSWASAGTTRFAFAKKKSRWLLRCQKLRHSAIVVVCELAPSLNIIWWCEAQVDEVENQRAPQKWYMYTHVVLTAIQHVLFMGGPNQGWWKRPTGDWRKQHEKKGTMVPGEREWPWFTTFVSWFMKIVVMGTVIEIIVVGLPGYIYTQVSQYWLTRLHKKRNTKKALSDDRFDPWTPNISWTPD